MKLRGVPNDFARYRFRRPVAGGTVAFGTGTHVDLIWQVRFERPILKSWHRC